MVITETGQSYAERIAVEAKALGATALAIESENVTLAQFEELKGKLEGFELRPTPNLVGPLRLVKDAGEIAILQEACALADDAWEHILTLIRPGVSEWDLAVELEYFMKKRGASGEAFGTIVASGVRSAMPHGRASDKLLEAGDFITFDFGAYYQGYNSDLTRTVVLGAATDRQREVYATVLRAQQAALDGLRPGLTGKDADALARDVITAAGYGEHFGHGLGHSLGRRCHDGPGLSSRSDITLAPGMVMTVEPGIYLEGWGGVRIEDDVVITESGCERLTHAPKELLELPV